MDMTSKQTASILLTGGTGFIGSHIAVELVAAGHRVVLLDNLCNSKASVAGRVSRIAGTAVPLEEGDVRDPDLVRSVLAKHGVTAVIHLAGLKAVGESSADPIRYWDFNVIGAVRLIQAMEACGVRKMVFSSSCTVYGQPTRLPVTEDHPLCAMSPYGRTKLAIEDIFRDLCRADPRWRVALLRYFNPVGAHESALIGEDPNGIPNNLMPYIVKVAAKELPELQVWGNDYGTPDGTAIRDYIHVVDLGTAHVKAVEHLPASGCEALNIGTGKGSSVLEVVEAFKKACGVDVPYVIRGRRAGDVEAAYGDPGLAERRIGWKARFGVERMCLDSWRWQQKATGR